MNADNAFVFNRRSLAFIGGLPFFRKLLVQLIGIKLETLLNDVRLEDGYIITGRMARTPRR